MPLDEQVVRLAKEPNIATTVTVMPDGLLQALPTWVDTDGEHILINTEPERQRFRNIERDPRITVLIVARDNPWDFAEIRGRVVETTIGQEARDHIDELSRRYVGTDYRAPIGPHGRVILRVAAQKVNTSAQLFGSAG
ncbi:MAG TPA: TIGR03618 family F420-dependent PPOX class oxidoreductase [Nitriliruptorales bacterium]|nr:TIGR03618 family F420-dependent PPOX class oxidoreductase [Nitriliruptorales bacterium]